MPVLVQVSQATREAGSSRMQASKTASETWSQSLSKKMQKEKDTTLGMIALQKKSEKISYQDVLR
jgi:hypothetical protein